MNLSTPNSFLARHVSRTRTLLGHELREQGPLGLGLLGAGVLLVLCMRFGSGAEAGEIGGSLPMVVPALAALLVGFAATDLLSRDAGSGLARLIAGAPVGRGTLLGPRLAVFGALASGITAALFALEAPRLPSVEPLVAALTAFVVAIALCGGLWRSSLGALVCGSIVCLGLAAGVAAAQSFSLDAGDLQATVRLFAEELPSSLSPAVIVPCGIAALICGTVLRGTGTRRFRRRLLATVAAALVFVTPVAAPALSKALAARSVPFEDPRMSVHVIASSGESSLLFRIEAPRGPWWSGWLVDPDTGERSALSHAEFESLGEARVGRGWLAEPLTVSSAGIRLRLAFADGTTSAPFVARRHNWPGLPDSSPRDRFAYISETSTLHVVSLIDGASREVCDIGSLTDVLSVSISPDGRWLALVDVSRPLATDTRGRHVPRVRLIDLTTDRVIATEDDVLLQTWRARPTAPVLRQASHAAQRRLGGRFATREPDGVAALDVPDEVHWLTALPDGRFVAKGLGGAVWVLASNGHTVRTLRAPQPRQ